MSNSFLTNYNISYDDAGIILIPFLGNKEDPIATISRQISDASLTLNTFDTELQKEISFVGIYHPTPELSEKDPITQNLSTLSTYIKDGKWPILMHSQSQNLSLPFNEFQTFSNEPLGYLQLSSRINLYKSDRGSNSSLMDCYQVSPYAITAGARSFSKEDLKLVESNHIPYLTDKSLYTYDYDLKKLFQTFPESVYLNLNLDFFSPTVFPSSDNLIPGGPHWWQGLLFIRELFKLRSIVAVSITGISENMPPTSITTVAQLICKLIAYQIFVSRHEVDIDIVSPPFYSTN